MADGIVNICRIGGLLRGYCPTPTSPQGCSSSTVDRNNLKPLQLTNSIRKPWNGRTIVETSQGVNKNFTIMSYNRHHIPYNDYCILIFPTFPKLSIGEWSLEPLAKPFR